jgi:hypothetical protein
MPFSVFEVLRRDARRSRCKVYHGPAVSAVADHWALSWRAAQCERGWMGVEPTCHF